MTEAFVLGRVGVDLTPPEPRVALHEAASFVRAVGGFAGNISTGLARLGVHTAVVSAVGDDGHGEHVRRALTAEGIDVRQIRTTTGRRTQLAFFEVWPPDEFPVTFHRSTPAPETSLLPGDLPPAIGSASVVIVSGALLAEEPARTTVLEAVTRRAARRRDHGPSWTILDLDWRPTLWSDASESPALMAQAAALSDVIIGSDAEFGAVRLTPEAVVASAPTASPRGSDDERLVVLKHGPAGVSLVSTAARRTLAGIPVDVLCGLGSGDAMTATFAAGLLRGLEPIAALERGNAAGAIVATRLFCSAGMPTQAEIDGLLARSRGGAVEVAR
jgi:5-dehydro-2-deoxygluconokinase